MKRCTLVLAGGQGKRLWPLTSDNKPKQLLPLGDGRTLLEMTLARCSAVDPESELFVITIARYAERIREIAQRCGATVLVEPAARNTAAAILYGCTYIQENYSPDAVLTIVPSDQLIPTHEYSIYKHALQSALHQAQSSEVIALVGVMQQYASTQFGFIQLGEALTDDLYRVVRFHEKPTVQVVARYYGNADMVWNTGMVISRVATLYAAYRTYAPEYLAMLPYYEQLPLLSFDTCILEKVSNAVVVRGLFSWQDVGSLDLFIPACRASSASQISLFDAKNNLTYVQKTLILAGVQDLCIIETEDKLVIMKRTLAQTPERVSEALQDIQ